MYYVYMITNQNNTVLYIGVTNNLPRRLYEHQKELVDGFSKKYHLHKLVYYEEYSYMVDAISREKQLKHWIRAKKNRLIEQMNPAWKDLSEVVFGQSPLPNSDCNKLNLLIETDLSLTETAVGAMLATLPPTWQARATRYKPYDARLRSTVGYTLLATILRDTYGVRDLPAMDTDPHGKPYLIDCPLYFSISHCKAAVACAVMPHPIGLDVQDILTDVSPALAARIAAPLDPASRDPRALTALWAQKEASAKLDGRGLIIGLEHLPLPHHTLVTQEYEAFVLCAAKENHKENFYE